MGKKVTRRCVWETNSSTTHSTIIMTEEQYEKWKWKNLYYYPPNKWYDPFEKLPKDKKPQPGCLYTQDEVLEFYKLKGYEYNPLELDDYDEDEAYDERELKDMYIKEMCDFAGYDAWHDDECLEFDDTTYTTPSGETIIVECKYGWDG